jgi:hypothetical protein
MIVTHYNEAPKPGKDKVIGQSITYWGNQLFSQHLVPKK